MRREYDTSKWGLIKRLDVSSLSRSDRDYIDQKIRVYSNDTLDRAASKVSAMRHKVALADLARRIVFKGVPYPDRDPDTLPVWSDPDK